MWNDVNSERKQENTARVTQDRVLRGLEELGIRPGEMVYVHSSLSAFGHVDGGADAVIDALLESFGPGGTVAVPTFTWERNHAKPVVEFDVANDHDPHVRKDARDQKDRKDQQGCLVPTSHRGEIWSRGPCSYGNFKTDIKCSSWLWARVFLK
jgi:hypothetical protein